MGIGKRAHGRRLPDSRLAPNQDGTPGSPAGGHQKVVQVLQDLITFQKVHFGPMLPRFDVADLAPSTYPPAPCSS
jgi:hypothetical protein